MNDVIRSYAAKPRELSDPLEQQGEDGFRASAYRRAAVTVDALTRPAAEILATEGCTGLVALPAIGWGIASALAEIVPTGVWAQLQRLRGRRVVRGLETQCQAVGEAI